jgi:hypothetical protein
VDAGVVCGRNEASGEGEGAGAGEGSGTAIYASATKCLIQLVSHGLLTLGKKDRDYKRI